MTLVLLQNKLLIAINFKLNQITMITTPDIRGFF